MKTDDRLIFEAYKGKKMEIDFKTSKEEKVPVKKKTAKKKAVKENLDIALEGCPECAAHVQDAAEEITAAFGQSGINRKVVDILNKYFANDEMEAKRSADAAFGGPHTNPETGNYERPISTPGYDKKMVGY